jgi:hypothetical protein
MDLTVEAKLKINRLTGKKFVDPALSWDANYIEVSPDKADFLVAPGVKNWVHPRIISDVGNDHPKHYTATAIDKQAEVFLYEGEPRNRYQEHGFSVSYKTNERQCMGDVSALKGQYAGEDVVLVGAGPSWQNVDYDKIDALTMVANYNFEVNADFIVYSDRRVRDDLRCVYFDYAPCVIGEESREYGDYTFKKKARHTGAEALHIAIMMGFDNIYLSGFDYKPGDDGYFHTFDRDNYYSDSKVKMFLEDFDDITAQNVYNLNKKSAVRKFPFVDAETLYRGDK